ncbi:beta strand repeat-containing protein [Aquimarina sp. 2201CG14-23]|uniref:beta strand repeat-containing protein n=1 Tax=Aquimarina mycalae TaxID=3040073 RepID=UPI002477DAA3|nr:Ig-like domain-containing protein [Aquimarina sp. 2201CG14-23]MDH7445467.1 Ig-like domain-containing protein [Aquimarina sp. 2201CG14-23]
MNFTIDAATDNGTTITETIVDGGDTYVLTAASSNDAQLFDLGGGDQIFFTAVDGSLPPWVVSITRNGSPVSFTLNGLDYDTVAAGNISVENQDDNTIAASANYSGSGAITITNTSNATNISSFKITPGDSDDLNDFGFHNINVTFPAADTTQPEITSVDRQNPTASTTNADVLVFAIEFSEPVVNVDTSDFVIGGGSTATVTNVADQGSNIWNLTVSGGDLASFNGNVILGLIASQNIQDAAGNALSGITDPTPESFAVDNMAPTGYSVSIDQSPINAGNDDAVSYTFAGAEVGATYNYTFTTSGGAGSVTGSGVIATATDQITGIDLSGLADGTITLSVTLTDTIGNTGVAATDTETKETIAPTGYSVSIDQSPINAGNDDAVSFTFAGAEVGATYNYTFTTSGGAGSVTGSGVIATATDQITGIDLSGLADGTITLSVTLTDVNGNTGVAATDTETKETIAPTGYSVSIDQSPINAGNDDAVSYTFAGAEVGATYNYTFTTSGGAGSVTGSGVIATATDQITGIDLSGLADGTITLSVTLTDVNGNTGVAATDTETKDTEAPTGYSVSIDQSPINAGNDDAVSYTFAGAEVGATYNYTFTTSGGAGSVTGSGVIATATDQITGIDLSGLADGTITLSVTLTDVNGNTGVAATDTETKDTARPSVAITSTESPGPTGSNPIPVTITFSESVSGFTEGEITVVNGSTGNFSGGTGTTYTVDITPSGAGPLTITVDVAADVATNMSGNGNTAAPQFSIGYDNVLSINDEILENGLTVYPIPSSNTINISGAINLAIERAEIFDIQGKLILSQKLNASSITNTIDISSIRSGLYLMTVYSETGSATKRIIKQ